MNLDIEDAIAAGQVWRRMIDLAEQYELRLRLDDVVNDPDLVRKAWAALTSDTPLLDHYPNGDPAVPPYTPKQVLLLANIEFMVIDHDAKEYQEAVARVREELGRHPPRICVALTKTGAQCRSYALAYSSAAVCSNHATAGAREHNREMQRREEEQLKQALRSIGLYVASKREA